MNPPSKKDFSDSHYWARLESGKWILGKGCWAEGYWDDFGRARVEGWWVFRTLGFSERFGPNDELIPWERITILSKAEPPIDKARK